MDPPVMDDKVTRAAGAVNRPADFSSAIARRPVGGGGDGSGRSRAATATGGPVNENTAEGDEGAQLDDSAAGTPPPYSGPSETLHNESALVTYRHGQGQVQSHGQGPANSGPQFYPGLPLLDYRQYSPPLFELSQDTTTITSKATYLSENAAALSTLIRSLAKVPPKPIITIQGKRGHSDPDFRVKLNLMNLLVPDQMQDRVDYLRCVRTDEVALRGTHQPALTPDLGPDAGLEDWAHRFVADPATVKTFTLERVIANLDMEWLEGKIRSLVATTKYSGVVTVNFQLVHAKVTVQTPDKVNKFFTSVTTLFSGKAKYEVVKSVWPFATSKPGSPNRHCVVQNEKTWWEEWKDSIKYAVITGRKGWVTNEDKLEYIMEGSQAMTAGPSWGSDM